MCVGKLSSKTVAVSAYHYNNVSEYDVHNLFGVTEQAATSRALGNLRELRPFVLSRSAYFSTGTHSAKWTGDNGMYCIYFMCAYVCYCIIYSRQVG